MQKDELLKDRIDPENYLFDWISAPSEEKPASAGQVSPEKRFQTVLAALGSRQSRRPDKPKPKR